MMSLSETSLLERLYLKLLQNAHPLHCPPESPNLSKRPQNFLRRCSTMACEAGPRYRDGERHSHKTFPGGASTFFMATSKFRKRTNGLFFSHNFSSGQLIALLERCHFSHRTFRTALENTVYAVLTHEKLCLRSAWKSYARKPASIAAKHL
jgi:hypothetical protein